MTTSYAQVEKLCYTYVAEEAGDALIAGWGSFYLAVTLPQLRTSPTSPPSHPLGIAGCAETAGSVVHLLALLA